VERYNLAQYSATGVPWNPTVPQNMWWGYVSFMGSSFFLGEMIFCFSMLMGHYEKF